MKRLIIFLWFWIGFVEVVNAQHTFQISYETEKDEFIQNSLIDNEGNILLVGNSGFTLDSKNALILKIAPDGTLQSKLIERQDTVGTFSEVTMLDNGNYFVSGSYNVGNDFYAMDHFWVVIFDENLEILAEHSYGINEPYVKYGDLHRSIVNKEREVAVVATNKRMVNNYLRDDFIMFRFSQQGDSLSSVQYESWPSAQPNSFDSIPGTDSLMMIGRGVLNTGQESLNFLDMEMNITSSVNISDLDGHKRYTNGNWLNSDEFLMLSNWILDDDKGREYLFSVFRVNTSGQYLQELHLDRPDTLEYAAYFTNLVVAPDSLIYVGGFQSYNNVSSTPSNCIIYLIDKELNLIGRKNFGGDANYTLMGIEATSDGGCFAYALQTNMHDRWYYERDVVMWKFLREDFEIITQLTDQPAMALNSKAWPNPADDELHISLDGLPTGSDFRLQIYNTAGQKFFDKALTVTAKSVQCRIGVLPAGTYVYQLQTATGQVGSGTFIKQ
ncbi:MAG TPA: T9SS type A sorting domain-containing protein [Bacteroidales bacterium]|nr:T9SS type A sorting domain-containing protein [Bacteroidales bacterium]